MENKKMRCSKKIYIQKLFSLKKSEGEKNGHTQKKQVIVPKYHEKMILSS